MAHSLHQEMIYKSTVNQIKISKLCRFSQSSVQHYSSPYRESEYEKEQKHKREKQQSFSSSEQLQDQFSHRDSDWPRFLYDSLSLCEHIFAVDDMKTLTVIMSSIFSLDSTDGQSEITVRSTATESRWSSWLKGACSINQEFRSFSRFL